MCVDNAFSKLFRSCLGEDTVYNFINSMVEESKYCDEKHFYKELVMTEIDSEDFKNSTKCWICDNGYCNGDVKERDHCDITRIYRASSPRDCNIKVNLNQKIPIVFHNLKNYDSHLIMQEVVIQI